MNDYYGFHQENVQGPANIVQSDVVQTTDFKQEEENKPEAQAPALPVVESGSVALLSAEEVDEFQLHWNSIQAKFVDEPHTSVEQADALVSEAVERIVRAVTNKKTMLNGQWINNADISTEDLRIALKGYRSFFKNLLAM